ncbi:MAG: PDZ domain-containing protein [Nitrospirae bacterium]|nr:MAG: PDZ domain-containing protein [Nitrospirota bacterium]
MEVIIDGHAYFLGGDIITNINEKPVTTPQQLDAILRTLKVGDQVTMSLVRNGKRQTVRYKLPEQLPWNHNLRHP